MNIDAALVKDIHARLQLLSCGQLLTFSGWSALASDIDLPRKGRVVKEAVYWLEKSSTAQVGVQAAQWLFIALRRRLRVISFSQHSKMV